MDRLKTTGGVSPELMEQVKAAMLEENANFSEAEEPSKRSGAGYPSLGGFIETHFNFSEEDSANFARCQRSDGSFYGTGGTCRKGTPAGEKVKEERKARAKKGDGEGGGSAKSEAKGGDSGEAAPKGEATAADLKTKVKLEYYSDEKEKTVTETLTLSDIKKDPEKMDALEQSARLSGESGFSKQQTDAAYRVLRDDHESLKAEIKSSGVTDKEMDTLLTGGPKRLKQQLQTQEAIDGQKLPMNSQGRIYAKINRDMRNNAKELIENEGKYTSLVAKIRAGKASEAEKDKYTEVFGWDATPKNVDRMMSNVAKINKARNK